MISNALQYGVRTCSPRLTVVRHVWLDQSFLTTNLTNLSWDDTPFQTTENTEYTEGFLGLMPAALDQEFLDKINKINSIFLGLIIQFQTTEYSDYTVG